ncbi:MAG TPA: UPF0280 family protein, partial [Candidatus Binatia bacterium]|nr:UPF0280 family protein [Candidatus Binatia bacterium]
LVTQAVAELTDAEVHEALAAGMRTADRLRKIGLIRSAALTLQGGTRVAEELLDSKLMVNRVHERNLVHA